MNVDRMRRHIQRDQATRRRYVEIPTLGQVLPTWVEGQRFDVDAVREAGRRMRLAGISLSEAVRRAKAPGEVTR